MPSLDIRTIKNNMTIKNVKDILNYLGVDDIIESENTLITNTICHCGSSMKLYYYDDNKMFHCYTDCGDSFDVFELIQRTVHLNFIDSLHYVLDLLNIRIENKIDYTYDAILDKYVYKTPPILKDYKTNVLNLFRTMRLVNWEKEGILFPTLCKYNISLYIHQNQIIIPHYDLNNRLVGIRARNLDEEQIAHFGKYCPVTVENITYKHPLSLNLYGININKNAIKRNKMAIIFESEKSVLMLDSILGDSNISVASCGSNLNQNQINLLVRELGVNTIILAYDKEYDKIDNVSNKYYEKLNKLCKKYSAYCQFYFLYDFDNLLEEKDSPIDKGYEVFCQLMKNKIKVR